MRRLLRGSAFALVLGAALIGRLTSALAAPELEESPRVATLARSIMSPFCPGRTLQSCPSPEAARWVADIRAWAAEGRSDDEILRSLAARVPGFDLDGPSAATSWLLGGLPIAAASLFLLFAVWHLRIRRQRELVTGGAVATADEMLDSLLDDELRETD